MSKSVIFYLSHDPTSLSKERHFKRTAERLSLVLHAPMLPFRFGSDLTSYLPYLTEYLDGSLLGHMVFLCHGYPHGFGHPSQAWGVTMRSPKSGQISVGQFAEHFAELFEQDCLISLGACLCSSDPWILNRWGSVSYEPGGLRSLSASLRDCLVRQGLLPDIRGHCVSGEIVTSPVLRRHTGVVGDPGETLFRLALPDVRTKWSNLRRFDQIVRGSLAESWLLGDESIPEQIRASWE